MENLNIEAGKYTPKIFFDAQNHLLEIKGVSYPENTSVFYDPVFSWLEQYLKKFGKHQKTIVNVELNYFNSSSSKVIMDFIDLLEEAASEGAEITVNWLYDEDIEEALEFGEEFGEESEFVKFNLLKKADV